MAFGISGRYSGSDGTTVEFAFPYEERRQRIGAIPARSVSLIRIYAHGFPGGIGDDDADSLTSLLGDRMVSGGTIMLLGCSTAGVEGHAWNPVGGIGLLARMIMYHGMMKLQGEAEIAKNWSQNLAGDLSRRIPNVYVMGLAGISFPLSRVGNAFGDIFEPDYRPRGLMADRFVYLNGSLQD